MTTMYRTTTVDANGVGTPGGVTSLGFAAGSGAVIKATAA
jgi:hypothetical protein